MKRSGMGNWIGVIIAVMSCLAMLLICAGAMADNPTSGNCGANGGENVTWSLADSNNDGKYDALTISGTGAMKDYESSDLPWRDSKEHIKSVEIGGRITRIGTYAFAGCSALSSVSWPSAPNQTSIGNDAFLNCGSLTVMTIPDGVAEIGLSAFRSCGLTSITIPASVTSIGKDAFRDNSNLSKLLFAENSHLGTIGNYAFAYTSLTSITIPASVTDIGNTAFPNTMKSISVEEGNTKYQSINGVLYRKNDDNKLILICYPAAATASSFTVPDGVAEIGGNAFYSSSNITSVTISNGVKKIQGHAFSSCSNLRSIIIGTGVETIESEAFYSCTDLSFTLASGRTEIQKMLFFDISAMTSVTIPDTVQTIDEEAFKSCNNLTSVSIPDSVTTIGKEAFNSNSLSSVILPPRIETVGKSAFSNQTIVLYPSTIDDEKLRILSENCQCTLWAYSLLKIQNNDHIDVSISLTNHIGNEPSTPAALANRHYIVDGDKVYLTLTSDSGFSIGPMTWEGTENTTITTGDNTYSFLMPANKVAVTIPAGISACSIEIDGTCTYTGSEITPAFTVRDGNKALEADKDYTVSFSNNTLAKEANALSDAPTVTVTGKGLWSGTKTQTFTIGKAPFTVTAKPKTITYGDKPANDGVGYSGFVNGEDSTVLNGTLDYDYNYEQYGNAGSYTITPKGLTADNYEISFQAGTLTVEPLEIGLSWTDGSFTYNGKEQAPTAAVIGTLNGDQVSVTVSGAVNAGENLIATAVGLTGAKGGNYKLPQAVTHPFSIAKAAAPTIAKVEQGEIYSSASFTVVLAGKIPADAGKLICQLGDISKEGQVTVSEASVDNNGNVTVTVSGGAIGDTITIPVNITSINYEDFTATVVVTLNEKLTQTVSFEEESLIRTYGDEDFTNRATVTGDGQITYEVVAGTDVAAVDGHGKVHILKAGSATIKASAAETATYNAASNTYTLTVNRKAATVKADDKSKIIGTEDPALTATVTGLIGSDTVSYTISRAEGEEIGTYAITPSGTKEQGNYTVSFARGTLTITDKLAPEAVPPTAKARLVYTGSAQELIEAGSAVGGTMQYALGADAVTAPAEGWSEAVPTGIDAGTYYVWYKVVGDAIHHDSVPACVTVEIVKGEENPEPVPPVPEPTPEPVSISGAKISIDPQEYTGKAVNPKKITVTLKGIKLIKGTDYTVAFSNNKNIGKATATITGKGNYTGTKTATFSIVPKKVSSASLKYKKKDNVLVVSWKKVAGIDGYEIEYGTDKSFKGAKKAKVSAKEKKTEYKIEKPTKKKTWYVRIRAWKKVKGKKYYSEWKVVSKKVK